MPKRYVLDSCAIIALFGNEEGADVVERLLSDAAQSRTDIFMHKLNLLEVYYGDYRAHGREAADAMLKVVNSLPITIISELSDRVFKAAGRFKATYRLSLADAIVLAEASVNKSIIITADHHELDVVQQKEPISFMWIR